MQNDNQSHWNRFPNTFNFTLPPSNLSSIAIPSQQTSLVGPNVSTEKNDSNAVEIELENSTMWNKFHQFGTEMIITKTGRRMFPTLRYQSRGLELNTTYAVYLQVCPKDDCRYKYSNGKWSVNGRLDVGRDQEFSRSRFYMHPDSPATGRLWMKQPISFHRVKLTNSQAHTSNGLILLNSMHKYRAIVHIVRMHGIVANMSQIVASATFDETEFIAVTAYQNEKVTQLKIDHNPFAKGFREQGKRHASPASDIEVEEDKLVKHRKLDERETKTPPCLTPALTKSNESDMVSTTYSASFSNLSPPNSTTAVTPLATVWNPMFQQNFAHNSFNVDHSVPLSNPFSFYPSLADWISLPRPYPMLPLNPMTSPPWWMCQKNFGLFF